MLETNKEKKENIFSATLFSIVSVSWPLSLLVFGFYCLCFVCFCFVFVDKFVCHRTNTIQRVKRVLLQRPHFPLSQFHGIFLSLFPASILIGGNWDEVIADWRKG